MLASSHGSTSVNVWDPFTGAKLQSVDTRGCISASGIALAPSGSDLVASFLTQQHLTLCRLNSTTGVVKCAMPECMGPLSFTGDGAFLVAGGGGGVLYLWHTCSGKMLRSWRGHYKAVTALCFARDDSFVVSGGEDALVCVWPLGQLVDGGHGQRSTMRPPLYTWTGHFLPITHLWGEGGRGHGQWRILSSSRDHTCKVWDLSPTNRGCVCSVAFPASVNCAGLDAQDNLYAGREDGAIAVVDFANCHTQRRSNAVTVRKVPGVDCEAPGDRCSCNSTPTRTLLRSGKTTPVTRLAFLKSRSVLASGHGDGSASVCVCVCIIYIYSCVCIIYGHMYIICIRLRVRLHYCMLCVVGMQVLVWDLRLRRPTWDIQAQAGPICSLFAIPVHPATTNDHVHGEEGRKAKNMCRPHSHDHRLASLPPFSKFELSPGDSIFVSLCGAGSSSTTLQGFSLVDMYDGVHLQGSAHGPRTLW